MAQTELMTAIEQPRIGKPGDPCTMVIFGASGDLTRRKLIPALYNLAKNELLSREFAVVGVARSQMSTEDYRKKVSEDIKQFATDRVEADLAQIPHGFAPQLFEPVCKAAGQIAVAHKQRCEPTLGNKGVVER